MGIQSAMFSGVSGLNANSQAMSVIGNNLANGNTLGFKSSSTVFADLLSSSVAGSGGESQVGRGVGLSCVDAVFSQGTFETTASGTDVAIEGQGFFVLKEPGDDTSYYTRAGAFRFNGDGNLVNPEGLVVQGKLFDPVENDTLLAADATDIQVTNVGLVPASATSELTFTTNLNENSTQLGPGNLMVAATVFAPTNAALGALTINGTAVPAAATNATIDKVAAINSITGTTGVTATQSGNFYVSDTAPTFGAGNNLAAGDIKINGYDIGAVAAGIDATAQRANVVEAINLLTGDTGVTATVGDGTNGAASNGIILSNTDGSAITITLVASAVAKTGMVAGTVAAGTNGKITLTRSLGGTITLGGGAAATGSIGFAATGAPETLTPNIINPADKTTYNYSASSQIYDSLGDSHLITVYWRLVNDATNTWNMGYTVDNDNTIPIHTITAASTPTVPLPLTFDSTGNLADTTNDGNPDPLTVQITLPSWTNGAATPQQIDLSFDCTQYDSDSVVIGQRQNGFSAGSLTNIAINGEGIVVASYSNGKQINVAQLALAKFQNPGGLKLVGANRYTAAPADVGIIRVGIPGSELGKVFTNSLEQSNVDMGQEFVKMITTQRGFSANSKIITTVDEMLSELINLKR